jgi:hypothetical protein
MVASTSLIALVSESSTKFYFSRIRNVMNLKKYIYSVCFLFTEIISSGILRRVLW